MSARTSSQRRAPAEVTRDRPRRGWPWLLALVAVSLGLWALIIWGAIALVRLV